MRIGILGGGQLAKMLCQAASQLGIPTLCAESKNDTCAAMVSPMVIGDLQDQTFLTAFAKQVEVITLETENIELATIEHVQHHCPVFPSIKALATCQDRLLEKQFLQQAGIEVAPFAAVNSIEDLSTAQQQLGGQGILKTRRMGYDGKGQVRLQTDSDLQQAFADIQQAPAIMEGLVNFDCECSQISVRNQQGEIRHYELCVNEHVDGILRLTRTDDALSANLRQQAEQYNQAILEAFAYVGVLTTEFFVCGDKLIANEMAPRVHNSGHWSIEGAICSQFENHIRAICNLPLGDCSSLGRIEMHNIIGQEPDLKETLRQGGAHYHRYGKSARPGRKLAHLTVVHQN